MRDRLSEMIAEIVTSADDTRTFEDVIADELIAKGVIVPPVKVGQTVYRPIITSKGEPAIWEIIVTSISIYIENGVSPNSYVIGHLKHTHCGESADFREFGKTVFLTREEAEKALAERREE